MKVEQENVADLEEVLQLLRSRNLPLTEKSLLAELTDQEQHPISSESSVGFTSSASFRETAYTSECNLALCYDEYERFLQWAINAEPEELRADVCAFLFPIFCHMCIDLLAAGRVTKYQGFLKRFEAEQLPFYMVYVRLLKRSKTCDSLTSSPLAHALRTNRFVVSMTAESEQAVWSILKHLPTVKAVIKSHMYISRYDGAKKTTETFNRTAGYLLGEPPPWINEQPVHLGIYEFVPEPGALQSAKVCLEKKGSVDVLKNYAGDRLGSLKPTNDAPPLDNIPLPPMTREEEIDQLLSLLDSEKRKLFTGDTKPSIYFYTLFDQSASPCCFDLTRDSEVLCTGNSDSSVSIYFLSPRSLANMTDVATNGSMRLYGHCGAVHGVSCLNDKRLLLSCSSDGTCRLWTPMERRMLNVYRLGSTSLWDVKFSPLSGYFAVGSSEGVVSLYSLIKEVPVRIFHGHLETVGRVLFHPNGNYVASGSEDRTVRLWDVRSGQCVRMFTGPKTDVQSIAFSHSGYGLAIGSADGRVLCMDIGHGTSVYEFYASDAGVGAIAYSMKDNAIATAGLDDHVTVQLINGESYLRYSFMTKSTPVLHVQFTRRNLLLAFGHLTVPSKSEQVISINSQQTDEANA